MRIYLAESLRWNRESGILTFVSNFLLPQQNLMGRLFPRYDLRNTVYFMEQLNRALYNELLKYNNVYYTDIDQITSNFGRRFTRDDSVWTVTHGAFLGDFDWEYDQNRLEVPAPMSAHYGMYGGEIGAAWWVEIVAQYRTLRQIDSVKLVVIDLDDTLWRGVAAEGEHARGPSEGWPGGFIEALSFLKKWGVLLAIISKNDEGFIERHWTKLTAGLIDLDDFAIRKINWRTKTENMAEVLKEVNLLSKSAVFIDDNPVERSSMKAAFPDIRVLGSHPYFLKRVLLWSPELQVAAISEESARRTEMVQGQIKRESERKVMSRDEFLASLDLKVSLSKITSVAHPKIARALELVNKTNQFNTTGIRWTDLDARTAFDRGVVFYVFYAADRFTDYGLVGVVVVDGPCIRQFVMSCRVAGLNIEQAVLSIIISLLDSAGHARVDALYTETSSNFVSKDMLSRCGFEFTSDTWTVLSRKTSQSPPHISISVITEKD